MSEISMNLVTQIIILATAIVGLIQVLRYKPKKKSEAVNNEENDTVSVGSSILAYFEPFFGIIGMFAFMLAFPLFMFLFTKVIGLMSHQSDTEAKTISPIELVSLKSDSLTIDSIVQQKEYVDFYKEFYNSILTPNSNNTKDNLTDSLVNICIRNNELKLATIVTLNFNSNNSKDDALLRIIDKSIESEDFKTANYCVKLFNSNWRRDSEAERVFYAINESLKKKLNPTKNIVHLADSVKNENNRK
jgi:hypothetical protein